MGRPAPTRRSTRGDDLSIGEKFQSSSEIAGSFRNSSGASVEQLLTGGRATERGFVAFVKSSLPNSEYRLNYLGSQNSNSKIRIQKENSPDHNLRSLNLC